MVIAFGHVYTQGLARESVRELLASTQLRVREQAGCVSYTFAETVEEPGHFVLVQQWRDRAAMEAHYGSPEQSEFQTQIGPYLTRTSELELYAVEGSLRPFDSEPIAQSDG